MEAKRDCLYNERIVDLRFRVSRLGILGKAYYELAEIKLKRHRAKISTARTQNLILRAALHTLREKDRVTRKNAGDLESLRKTAASLRVTSNHRRQLAYKRQGKLEWQITGTHSAELQCAEVLDPNTPPEIRIRVLEHQVAWIQVKTREVQILMKHYVATVQSLRDDWITYDAKLAALKGCVDIKHHEYELLINTHHDGVRARDAAKLELEELLAFLFHFGKKESYCLCTSNSGIDFCKGLISKELRFKILKAIEEIKSVMSMGSMREMYQQFILHEKQSLYLESICEEMKRALNMIKSHCPPTRKSSMMRHHEVARMVQGTREIVRRQSSLKGSSSLLLILDCTQKLVDKLHVGQITLIENDTIETKVLQMCKDKLVLLLKALHRKLKHINKAAAKKTEYETREKAHWQREEAEVAQNHKAAEEARRKYEKKVAEREAEREEAVKRLKQIHEAAEEQEQEHKATADDSPNLIFSTTLLSPQDSSTSREDAYRHDLSSEVTGDLEPEQVAAEMATIIFLPKIQHRLDVRADAREEIVAQRQVEAEGSPNCIICTVLETADVGSPTMLKVLADESRQARPEPGLPEPVAISSSLNLPPRPADTTIDIDIAPHSDDSATQKEVSPMAGLSCDASKAQHLVAAGQFTTVALHFRATTSLDVGKLTTAALATDESARQRSAESLVSVLPSAESKVTETSTLTTASMSMEDGTAGPGDVGFLAKDGMSNIYAGPVIASTVEVVSNAEGGKPGPVGGGSPVVMTLSCDESSTIEPAEGTSGESAPPSPTDERSTRKSPEETSFESAPIEEARCGGVPSLQAATLSDGSSATKLPEGLSVERGSSEQGRTPTVEPESHGSDAVQPWTGSHTVAFSINETLAARPAEETRVESRPTEQPRPAEEGSPPIVALPNVNSSSQTEEIIVGSAPTEQPRPVGASPLLVALPGEKSLVAESSGATSTDIGSVKQSGVLTSGATTYAQSVSLGSEEEGSPIVLADRSSGEGSVVKPPDRSLTARSAEATSGESPGSGQEGSAFLSDESSALKLTVRTSSDPTPRPADGGISLVRALSDDKNPPEPGYASNIVEATVSFPGFQNDENLATDEVGLPTLVISTDIGAAQRQTDLEEGSLSRGACMVVSLAEAGSPSVDDSVPYKPPGAGPTLLTPRHDLGAGQPPGAHSPVVVVESSNEHPSQNSGGLSCPVILPRSPSGAPVATCVRSPKVGGASSDTRIPELTSMLASLSETPVAAVARSPPKFLSSEESAAVCLAGVILPRSPDGAPIAAGVKFHITEAASGNKSKAQRLAPGTLLISSPSLPVATGTRLPLDVPVARGERVTQVPDHAQFPRDECLAIETKIPKVPSLGDRTKAPGPPGSRGPQS